MVGEEVARRCVKGNRTATAGCRCSYCAAVFDEWAQQAIGFQRWHDSLSPEIHERFFGPEGPGRMVFTEVVAPPHPDTMEEADE